MITDRAELDRAPHPVAGRDNHAIDEAVPRPTQWLARYAYECGVEGVA